MKNYALKGCHTFKVIAVFICVRFGLPFVLHLEKTIAWDLLQKEILEKMKYFLRPTVCVQVSKHFDTPA